MPNMSYQERRGQLETYFDRTAVEAWSRLTSDAPVSRIRSTVRTGRERMRSTLLDWLPADLRGRRLLDAGCGTGALAIEAARRGADVVAVDVAPTLITLARERTPEDLGAGSILFLVGDMSDDLGHFDHVVAMDSLIHYQTDGRGGPARRRRGADLPLRTLHLCTAYPGPDPDARDRPLLSQRRPSTGDRTRHQPHPRSPDRRRAGARPLAHRAQRADRLRLLHLSGAGTDTRMSRLTATLTRSWLRLGPRFLPFADAGTTDLPLGRLLRLALFQVSVGIALVLLNGTLNRVAVVELGVPAWLVSLMVSLPLLFAPLRALVGFRSDHHRSALGWRRVPYIWLGTLLQFGGLAIMPFALLVLSGDSQGPAAAGPIGAGLAFLLVGAGLHITQTAGLALVTDLAPRAVRPRAVALLYVMLLLGMAGSSLLFGQLLEDFSQLRLIQVIQGAAVVTLALNLVALWKQESRDPSRTGRDRAVPAFSSAWADFLRGGRSGRLLVSVGLGTAGFSMQDILLEPYGGQVLGLTVAATTELTAVLASGTLVAFALASRRLSGGSDPFRLSGMGALVGIFAFAAVVLSAPLESVAVFRAGTFLIGLGGGLFAVGTLTAAMGLARGGESGLALGAWGAVQATAAGLAIALGGVLRDLIGALASQGTLGAALSGPAVGYGAVYHLEILFLFATLAAIGPLVGTSREGLRSGSTPFGLAEFPG